MRAIKFRMWDFENKEMIDGDSLAFEEYAPIKHLLSREGIMQFTGLQDRNGKEIYEGDVLNDDWRVMKVFWDDGGFCLRDQKGSEWLIQDYQTEPKVEIIGNIYENPELIEVIA